MREPISPVKRRPGRQPTGLSPRDVIRVAANELACGQRLDMRELAVTLGVGRTTLYRLVGDREHLLAMIIAESSTEGMMRAQASARRRVRSGPRALVVLQILLDESARSGEVLRQLLETEGPLLTRVLSDHTGLAFHSYVNDVSELLRQDMQRGWVPPLPIEKFARVLAVVTSSLLYMDLVSAGRVDHDAAMAAVEALFAMRADTRASNAG